MGLSLALGSEITSPKARLRAISMTLEVFGQNASPRVIRTLVVVPSVMDPKRLLLPRVMTSVARLATIKRFMGLLG
ncbi:MAG: hypothetical protein CVV19_03700 [Gammaproteobacteria bacterium HGW-Gammaproteobacteria-9]|jgi:hypothetical protein|nr:hypothetical protein HV98_12520 [Pseudomonas aeruginosa]KJS65776.1 MAG: hypothetical protein JL55_37675 [[Pseudomonas] sp. BICA1-14]OCX55514.1 hypothetical protein BFM99_18895 [Stutzerimonas stutzeri]PKM00412.1 MAG: hypothetical protein CVV19_03700 [Gammaproteobacteria bacterium HGW-Gammaproteobacteria-9]RCL53810.1 MAG: hypothetical protein DBW88_14790 [Pseudomonas sp.]